MVDKFSATGAYINQITGRCAAEKELLPCKLIRFTKGEPGNKGITVDPTGKVWFVDGEGNIDEFGDGLENEYISTCQTGFGGGEVGVDAEDKLYMKVGGYRAVKVDSTCEVVTTPFGTGEFIADIAVDPGGNPSDRGGGEVYIDYGTVIEALGLGGSQIETFGLGDLGNDVFEASRGVGVDGGNGTVYATDVAAKKVVIFGAVTLPSVVRLSPSEQTPRSVTLNGSVNPEGFPVTSCVFEYVPASEYEPEAANRYPNS